MKQRHSWEITEEFWARTEPLLPPKERDSTKRYRRRPGGGRRNRAERWRGYFIYSVPVFRGMPARIVRVSRPGISMLSPVVCRRFF
jgi:hypothetical protein